MPFLAQAPQIATPKPKKPKAAEEPAAQKPDFKLTGDMLKGDAPLRRQYERHIEERGREEQPGAAKPRGGDLKRRRDREREIEETGLKGKPQPKQRRRRNALQDEAMQQAPGKGIRRRKKSRKESPCPLSAPRPRSWRPLFSFLPRLHA